MSHLHRTLRTVGLHPSVLGIGLSTFRHASIRAFSSTQKIRSENSENTQVTFSRRPGRGERATYDCFGVRTVDEPQDIVAQSIPDTVVCETLILSVDPYLRCRMNDDTGVDYTHPYTLGEAMSSGGVGRVIQSTSPHCNVGDLVTCWDWPWQRRVQLPAGAPYSQPGPLAAKATLAILRKLVAPAPWQRPLFRPLLPFVFQSKATTLTYSSQLSPTHALGALGINMGLTAYFGICHEAALQPGQTCVVSGAAGAVGHLAVQLARQQGARVVGIAGGSNKCEILRDELGCDDTIDYKSVANGDELTKLIAAACPNGIDAYFDNVGGDLSERVILRCNQGARVVICGQISSYETEESLTYPDILSPSTQAVVDSRGIVRNRYNVLFYYDQWAHGMSRLEEMVANEEIIVRESTVHGIENAGVAFVDMMAGANVGKQLVIC